jgi:hypothetical protein
LEELAAKARQELETSLASLTARMRAEREEQQRAYSENFVQASQQQYERFRQRLDAALRACLVAALSGLHERAGTILDSYDAQAPTAEAMLDDRHKKNGLDH